MNNQNAEILLSIAKGDLDSSKLLYKDGQYRTSYLLFQQAVEKTNKSLLLLFNLASTEDIEYAKHDQFKIIRKHLVAQENGIGILLNQIGSQVSFRNNSLIELDKIESSKQTLQDSIRFIDGLKHKDLVNLSLTDLNYLLRVLQTVEKLAARLVRKSETLTSDRLMKSKRVSKDLKSELKRNIKSELELEKIVEVIKKSFEFIGKIWLSFYTVYFCGLVTTQHSSKTRYPEKEFNPLTVYKHTLPLVKKQPQFMLFLENVITTLKELNKEGFFSDIIDSKTKSDT